MDTSKDFVQRHLEQNRDNLAQGGMLLNEDTLGRAAVEVMRKRRQPTIQNLRDHLINQRVIDPSRDHLWVPALDLLEELAPHIQ